jgi:hypothetical protein
MIAFSRYGVSHLSNKVVCIVRSHTCCVQVKPPYCTSFLLYPTPKLSDTSKNYRVENESIVVFLLLQSRVMEKKIVRVQVCKRNEIVIFSHSDPYSNTMKKWSYAIMYIVRDDKKIFKKGVKKVKWYNRMIAFERRKEKTKGA